MSLYEDWKKKHFPTIDRIDGKNRVWLNMSHSGRLETFEASKENIREVKFEECRGKHTRNYRMCILITDDWYFKIQYNLSKDEISGISAHL